MQNERVGESVATQRVAIRSTSMTIALSSAEASYSLHCRLGKNARRLGRGEKVKLPALPFSLPRAPAPVFLSLVFTNRSLYGGESEERVIIA